jgi:hypothetical protein
MRHHRLEPSVPTLVVGELERRLMEQVGVTGVAVELVHKVPHGEARELGTTAVRSGSRGCMAAGAGSGQHRRPPSCSRPTDVVATAKGLVEQEEEADGLQKVCTQEERIRTEKGDDKSAEAGRLSNFFVEDAGTWHTFFRPSNFSSMAPHISNFF